MQVLPMGGMHDGTQMPILAQSAPWHGVRRGKAQPWMGTRMEEESGEDRGRKRDDRGAAQERSMAKGRVLGREAIMDDADPRRDLGASNNSQCMQALQNGAMLDTSEARCEGKEEIIKKAELLGMLGRSSMHETSSTEPRAQT